MKINHLVRQTDGLDITWKAGSLLTKSSLLIFTWIHIFIAIVICVAMHCIYLCDSTPGKGLNKIICKDLPGFCIIRALWALLLLDGWGMLICEKWESLPTRCTWQSHDFPLSRSPFALGDHQFSSEWLTSLNEYFYIFWMGNFFNE